jgi:acyl-CoA thioesterase-2
MAKHLNQLGEILDLEPIELNIFRGHSPQTGWLRIFGGLVIAQALVACSRTVEGRLPHSLHGYFILPGDPSAPIIYDVDRIRDGKSFTTRRCNAIQHGQAIFSLSASFQVEETGLEHSLPMPDVPDPESLPGDADAYARLGLPISGAIGRLFERERALAIELRPVDVSRYLRHEPVASQQYIWIRAASPLPDDPAVHRAALAYLSDLTLLETALAAHGRSVFDGGVQMASLDHAVWFHRPFRADEWLLYAQDSPNAGGARGFTRGLLYTRDMRLVASVAQEGLIRLRPDKL